MTAAAQSLLSDPWVEADGVHIRTVAVRSWLRVGGQLRLRLVVCADEHHAGLWRWELWTPHGGYPLMECSVEDLDTAKLAAETAVARFA